MIGEPSDHRWCLLAACHAQAAERHASGAAGSGSEARADAGSRRLHAIVRPGRCSRLGDDWTVSAACILQALSRLPSLSCGRRKHMAAYRSSDFLTSQPPGTLALG